jgi:hypothetical protein
MCVLFSPLRTHPPSSIAATFPRVRLPASVSDRRFSAFWSVRGGFRAPVSERHFQFPFRRGGDRFDCRLRPVRRAPFGIRWTPARSPQPRQSLRPICNAFLELGGGLLDASLFQLVFRSLRGGFRSKLLTPETITPIQVHFHLPRDRTEVQSDFHYQSTETANVLRTRSSQL